MQLEVEKWMRAFGQDVPSSPTIPSIAITDLRANLIEEEAIKETVTALRDLKYFPPTDVLKALTEIADGLCDSLVVIHGTLAAFGLDGVPLFQNVMESNWSKLWTDDEVAQHFQSDEWSRNHTVTYRTSTVGERRALVKRNDGKIIKSPSYSPANLLPLIQKQMQSYEMGNMQRDGAAISSHA